MRILQINCVYGKGSTGRIVAELHHYYQAADLESMVLYGRGGKADDSLVCKVSSEAASKMRSGMARFTGNLYGMARRSTAEIERIIDSFCPEVVHLHCINGNFCNIFSLISWLKEKKIPTVITQHAEFFYTGNCGYAFECEQWRSGCNQCADPVKAIGSKNGIATAQNWNRMKEAFRGFQNLQLIGVSDWVSNRSNESAILGNYLCRTIMNGVDTRAFTYQASIQTDHKEVIYVTPYFEDENKGGRWLLKLAEATKNEAIHYTVVGPARNKYKAGNITFTGQVSEKDKLAEYYAKAAACVVTSRQETFSMVCAEALCCGTPIIGFEAGAPEMICLPEFSSFVPYGDIGALKEALLTMLKRQIIKRDVSLKACQRYSCERMAQEYISIYEQLTQ
jgi:glycosyltransferase involved in cell wall biosynthesis